LLLTCLTSSSVCLRNCQHGVILKVVTTNICGSDQHMVRGTQTRHPLF
jgi:threonine dehydrogenase-like Zn-dependent dehydrogenase